MIGVSVGNTVAPPVAPDPNVVVASNSPHSTLQTAQVLSDNPDSVASDEIDPSGSPQFFQVPVGPNAASIDVTFSWASRSNAGAGTMAVLDSESARGV